MAGESLALQNFMVSIGLELDPQDVRKATQDHAAVEARITKTNAAEAEKREKVEAKAAAKREKSAVEAAKKDAARNKAVLNDAEKGLLRVEQVAKRVAATGGAIGGALAGSAVFTNIAGVANAYSKLLTESQRTGASPKNIEALVYSLGQRGVDKGAARSSFGNFARTIQQSPGLKALLSGSGIDMSGDTADAFAQLGKYFNKMPPQTALAMAGRYGIDQDTLNALEHSDVAEGMKGYDKIADSFGLDPDKASKDARGFSNAYDRMAEDLKATQAKIADNFYKPLTAAMTSLSDLLEGNGSKVTALGTAFEGLALTLSVSAIPRLLRFAGILSGITAPPWLLPLIAYLTAGSAISKQSADAIQGSKPGANDVYVDPETGLATPVAPGAGNQVIGKGDSSHGRAALGRRLGMQTDTRNWWQRTMPKALGGQEPPTAPQGSGGSRSWRNNNPGNIEYGPYAQSMGATGSDGRFAIFPSYENGRAAQEHLLFESKGYSGLTLAQAIAKWAPSSENDVGAYTRAMANAGSGVSDNTLMSQFTPEQRSALLDAMQRHEGWKPGIPKSPPTLKGKGIEIGPDGQALNPDGTPTMQNFNSGTGNVTAPGPQSYNERGDTNYTQHISVSGVQKPQEVADAVSLVARRGAQDHIRFIEGTSV